jgi:hypothetical protein
MHTSNYWTGHFKANSWQKRVNWNLKPGINREELIAVLSSLQAWQLGETSGGSHLIAASTKYAQKVGDPEYINAVKLFIKEEQKHGNSLGTYLDAIGQPRIQHNWGDSLFRKVRYFNTSMELWTVAVIIVESTAQIFYQALKDATGCELLKEICTDILVDESYHITFQTERLAILFDSKNNFSKSWRRIAYKYFFYATSLLVWQAHKRVFIAGGNTFDAYKNKMRLKFLKTIKKITNPVTMQLTHS